MEKRENREHLTSIETRNLPSLLPPAVLGRGARSLRLGIAIDLPPRSTVDDAPVGQDQSSSDWL
jgi:hypothetical protein